MELHERLKHVREDMDMSQADVAAALGTTRQQISKYETGLQDMTAAKLYEFCRLYGISADYLLGLPRGLAWPR